MKYELEYYDVHFGKWRNAWPATQDRLKIERAKREFIKTDPSIKYRVVTIE